MVELVRDLRSPWRVMAGSSSQEPLLYSLWSTEMDRAVFLCSITKQTASGCSPRGALCSLRCVCSDATIISEPFTLAPSPTVTVTADISVRWRSVRFCNRDCAGLLKFTGASCTFRLKDISLCFAADLLRCFSSNPQRKITLMVDCESILLRPISTFLVSCGDL